MLLDNAQPDDAQRLCSPKRWKSRRITPAHCWEWRWWPEDISKRAPRIWRRRRWRADPKLLEAQELLARLALEDNNNPKATEEAKKALAMDPNSVRRQERFWPPSTCWRIKRTPRGIRRRLGGYETIGHFFVLNRRYEEGIQYSAKPSSWIRSCTARARNWASI